MRIEENPPTGIYGSGAAGSASGVDVHLRTESGRGPEPAASDSAQLSNAANWVTLARQVSAPGRDVRVSGIIAQVQSGQYRTDPQEVGSALIRGHLQG